MLCNKYSYSLTFFCYKFSNVNLPYTECIKNVFIMFLSGNTIIAVSIYLIFNILFNWFYQCQKLLPMFEK